MRTDYHVPGTSCGKETEKVRKEYHVPGTSCGKETEKASAAEVAAVLHVKGER